QLVEVDGTTDGCALAFDLARDDAREQRRDLLRERAVVERLDRGRLDVVSERLEEPRGVLDRGDDVRMRRAGPVAAVGPVRDAQHAGIRAGLGGEWLQGR